MALRRIFYFNNNNNFYIYFTIDTNTSLLFNAAESHSLNSTTGGQFGSRGLYTLNMISTRHIHLHSVTELAVRIFNIHIKDVALYFK